MSDWLTEADVVALKVGDRVGVTAGDHYNPPTVETIIRRTTTQILTTTARFNKRGRSLAGSTFRARHLTSVAWAEEMRADMLRSRVHRETARTLREHKWGAMTLEQLKRVQALLDELGQSPDNARSNNP